MGCCVLNNSLVENGLFFGLAMKYNYALRCYMLCWCKTHGKVTTHRKRRDAFWCHVLVHHYDNWSPEWHLTLHCKLSASGLMQHFWSLDERCTDTYIHGTTMGSPVSVVVALQLHVMKNVEEGDLVAFHFPLCFYKQYVDDTCRKFKCL